MSLQLQAVKVETGSADREGQLVFRGQYLVAIVVKLSNEHGSLAGKWFLEAGFGRADNRTAPVFDDLQAAQHWILERLAPES